MTRTSTRTILFVAFPGVQMLDLVGPLEIFEGATTLLRRIAGAQPPPYRVIVATADGRRVAASNGLSIDAHASFRARLAAVDTLVVPGALDIEGAVGDARLVRFVRAAATKARRVASVCSGSFVLAEAGLLDGKTATTHWAGCEALAARYPRVRVDPNPIFVRDGAIVTSAGVTAGMDLALALVEEDLGHDVAVELARWFVMFMKRPGGQAQFSTHLRAQASGSGALDSLLGWIVDHLHADLSVPVLARRMRMSPRHFARVFRKDVGVTPAAYVLDARRQHARRLLEESDRGLKSIVTETGFGSIESLRRAFRDELGVTPAAYRERFQTVARAS
jgi:transcriptional regulator GlxA family with amidase domain